MSAAPGEEGRPRPPTGGDAAGRAGDESAFRELGDPEFFTYWAEVRISLAYAPMDDEAKRRYDAVKAEFRRRIDGGLPAGLDN